MSYLTTLRVPPEYQDAFGRLRVSEPVTLFDSDFLTSSRLDQWSQLTTGTGAITYVINNAHVSLTSAGAAKAVRQGRPYVPYIPGKSFLVFATGILVVGGGVAGVTARIGLFDDVADKTVNPTQGNGFFFQLSGTALSVVYRTGISGVQTDTVVPQASWNIDPLNGTGRSGITIVPGDRQIFFIEMEWLGTGSVVLGIIVNRQLVPCHRFDFANQPGTSAYTNRGSLPVRYELSSAAAVAQMQQICCTVISEGGRTMFTPLSRVIDVDRANSNATVTNTVEQPLIAVRLKSTRNRASLIPISMNAMSSTNGFVLVALYRFITPDVFGAGPLTAPVWTAANALTVAGYTDVSVAEFDISATAIDVTGVTYPFIRLSSFYISTATKVGTTELQEIAQSLSANIQGNPDWYILTARRALTTGGSENVYAAFQWLETE